MAIETIYENPNVALSGGEGMVTNLLLIPGETYQIVWDGDEYTSTAAEVPFNGTTVVAIGDLGIALGTPTGEYPFLIGALPDGSIGYTFTTESGVTSHSLVIYRDAPVTGETIVLKDRDGNKNYYNPPNGVRFEMGDGNTQLFINASDVPESVSVTVNPDFTGDKDMTVIPANGTQFSEVIVKKPELLIPENIAKGITIAGILGELAGGAELKIASGVAKPSVSGPCTVTHNLGVIPNIILVQCGFSTSGTTAYINMAVGLRIEGMPKWTIATTQGTVNALLYRANITAQANNGIAYANETTFRFGTPTYPACAVASNNPSGYNWYALGGLD